MREATFGDPLDKAIKRHAYAVEQLAKIAHYVDRDFMGRAPTEHELLEFQQRNKAVSAALNDICRLPCPDFKTLRRKAVFVWNYLPHGSLGQRNERALVLSILNMSKATHVDA